MAGRPHRRESGVPPRMNPQRLCADPEKKPRDTRIMVCVNEHGEHGFSGLFYHLFLPEEFPFSNGADMLLRLDRLFDELDHPQAYFRARDLTNKAQSARKRKKRAISREPLHTLRRGRVATFQIIIRYRQNASWQGELHGAGEQAKTYFRSALELLRLMDSALRWQTEPAVSNT